VRLRRPSGSAGRPLNFTVRRHVSRTRRIPFLALTAVLYACGDPRAAADREAASVRALAVPGASAESVRLSLARRGYDCADGLGPVQIQGARVPNTPYVYCTKRIAGDFACAYRVAVSFLKRAGPPDISANSERICL
jgi:hypothetical protein